MFTKVYMRFLGDSECLGRGMDVALVVCMSIPGMPFQVTVAKEIAEKLAEQSSDVLLKALSELEFQKRALKKK
jgi:hypothetical protein